MGIQSAVMAEQFGTLFQYGKRRISAMSNEEFNKLTPQMLQERMTREIEGMIPEMKEQIKAMRPMVELIISEFAQYILLATEEMQKLTVAASEKGITNIQYLATHLAHGHIPGIAGHPSSGIDQQDDPNKFVPPKPKLTPTLTPTPTPTGLSAAQIVFREQIDEAQRKYNYLVGLITEARKSLKLPNLKSAWKITLKKNIGMWFAEAQPLAKQLAKLRVAYKKRYGVWY